MTKRWRDWYYILAVLLLMALVELVNMSTGRILNQYSIVPRDLSQIIFIITSPLLHGSLSHFLSNLLPFTVLSFLLLEFGLKRYLMVSALLVVTSGTLVWLFAREAYHLGASGVLYGYFAYLILAGFLSRRLWLAVISLIVLFFYGGMIWGVLPTNTYISWESHLFGFLCGLILAWVFRAKPSASKFEVKNRYLE